MSAKLLLIFIALYRKIAYKQPQACRFSPSCSVYAEQSLELHGISGVFPALMRIIRCNQLFKGGYDPVR